MMGFGARGGNQEAGWHVGEKVGRLGERGRFCDVATGLAKRKEVGWRFAHDERGENG